MKKQEDNSEAVIQAAKKFNLSAKLIGQAAAFSLAALVLGVLETKSFLIALGLQSTIASIPVSYYISNGFTLEIFYIFIFFFVYAMKIALKENGPNNLEKMQYTLGGTILFSEAIYMFLTDSSSVNLAFGMAYLGFATSAALASTACVMIICDLAYNNMKWSWRSCLPILFAMPFLQTTATFYGKARVVSTFTTSSSSQTYVISESTPLSEKWILLNLIDKQYAAGRSTPDGIQIKFISHTDEKLLKSK